MYILCWTYLFRKMWIGIVATRCVRWRGSLERSRRTCDDHIFDRRYTRIRGWLDHAASGRLVMVQVVVVVSCSCSGRCGHRRRRGRVGCVGGGCRGSGGGVVCAGVIRRRQIQVRFGWGGIRETRGHREQEVVGEGLFRLRTRTRTRRWQNIQANLQHTH